MSVRSFFDTNVLIYADDFDSPKKQDRAKALFREHRLARTGAVSIQVLQEYFVVATKKLRIDPATARRRMEIIAELDVVVPDVDDVLSAVDLHRVHKLSFWDCLLLRTTKLSGCRVLLTEDLQDRREIDGVQIVNPFV